MKLKQKTETPAQKLKRIDDAIAVLRKNERVHEDGIITRRYPKSVEEYLPEILGPTIELERVAAKLLEVVAHKDRTWILLVNDSERLGELCIKGKDK